MIRIAISFSAACFLLFTSVSNAEDAKQKQEEPRPVEVYGIRNVHVAGNIMLAGQPTPEALSKLAEEGYSTVITLRHEVEERFDEKAACEKLGLKFIRLPINAPGEMDEALIRKVCEVLKDASPEAKVLCHCAGANRVGAVWIPYRVEHCELPVEAAQKEAAMIGLKTKELEEQALRYLSK